MDDKFRESIKLRRTRCSACGHVITTEEIYKKVRLLKTPASGKCIVFTFECFVCESMSELRIIIPDRLNITSVNKEEFRELSRVLKERNFVSENSFEEQLYFEGKKAITAREHNKFKKLLDGDDALNQLGKSITLDGS